MGLSTTISTAFFTLILITGTAYIVTMNLDLMTATTEPLEDYLVVREQKYRHQCVIDSWDNKTSNSVDLNITNTGEEGVRVSELNELDVILTFTNLSGQVTSWITYDQKKPSSTHWAITQVYTNGVSGDIINPIHLSGDVYGIWDPDETLEIRIRLTSTVLEFEHVKIGMPYGYVANKVLQ